MYIWYIDIVMGAHVDISPQMDRFCCYCKAPARSLKAASGGETESGKATEGEPVKVLSEATWGGGGKIGESMVVSYRPSLVCFTVSFRWLLAF